MPRKLIALALVWLVVLGGATSLALAQVESSDAAAEAQPQPEPGGVGPESGQPWTMWSSDSLDVGQQVFAQIAYSEFWARRGDAFANPSDFDLQLDLGGVLDGDPLASDLTALHALEAKGQAAVLVVEHHPTLTYATDDELVLYDTYVDRSYLIDARTRAPIGDGQNTAPTMVSMAYRMRQIHDDRFPTLPLWKVVDSVRVENP